MCFADGSLAPAAPGAGQAGPQRPLSLTAPDGDVLMAHEGRAATPSKVGIVVMPDVRGLHAYYRDLTVRLAEVGWEAVAIDYFGRTADTEERSDAFEFMPHVQQTTPEGIGPDVQAGVAHLRSLGVEKVFTLGFCFGGGYSWRQSADTPGLAGCIGFYGRSATVLPVLDRMTAPLLMLVAGADANIPVEDPKQVAELAPVEVDFVVFEGMPHSFFDRTAPEHAEACVKAWNHIIAFVTAHSS
ncbi:MAG: Dienelactone hydrolase-like enzyme [Frankiales bacterium]|nr:Dienelactone hydrolase-like enzyme [Frankiales bacterium]